MHLVSIPLCPIVRFIYHKSTLQNIPRSPTTNPTINPPPPGSYTSTITKLTPLDLSQSNGMESDEEIRRVPTIGEHVWNSVSGGGTVGGADRVQPSSGGESQKKRGRTPADKENKKLKR
ncbi:hypothetical protein ACFE04_018127 [Oxalis oulophora]